MAFSLGDLRAFGSISYGADGPWPGSQCAALASYSDSYGGGQYFRVNTLNLGAMSASTGFSICIWFVFDATTYEARIFDFGMGDWSSVLSLSRSGSSNLLQLQFGQCDYGPNWYYFPNPIVNGQWRHVCVVNQGSSWSFYDNGALSAFLNSYCSLNNVSQPSNFIGRSNYNYQQLLVGRVDEIRIYEKPLLPSDVASIYSGRFALLGAMRFSAECTSIGG